MSDVTNFESTIGYNFKDNKLLETVFTHRSYLNENRSLKLEHNERLEFLGDAVLELIVTEYLYKKYSQPEGVLTSWRSALVRGTSLSEVARKVNLDDYMKMSKGERRSSGKSRAVILANATEACIGALYIDGGLTAAKDFIDKYIIGELEEIIQKGADKDPKSVLQERTQNNLNVTPQYKVISETGPDHDKKFLSGVWIGDKMVAQGKGSSKQLAEQDAASCALDNLK